MRIIAGVIFAVLVALGALLLFGPREPVRGPIALDETAIAADPAGYLAWRERDVPDLRPGAEKRVIWADPAAPGRTARVVVYLHGFSATSEEIRPLPDDVAAGLGANLVYTRLAGHGRDGDAMAEATVPAWMTDVAEALAVARAIGDEIILIGTSTGGTLAMLAAFDPRMDADLRALVLISPNFGVQSPLAPVLTLPFARWIVPAIGGARRSFEATSPAHAAWWTTDYPTVAVVPMAAAVQAARALPLARGALPLFVAFSPDDAVVDPAATRAVAQAWGGPVRLQSVVMGEGDDPSAHVIAGDIMSPGQTAGLTAAILDWLAALPEE
ncbi:MAG: alpha/beta fold hydrolase [Pseudomonadota bacterium]